MALPTVKLGNSSIPAIGFGAGTAWFNQGGNEASRPLNQELISSLKSALELGYRHVDAAEVYGTEREVGIAIQESGIPRAELFVTTKVYPHIGDPLQAAKASLERLQLAYVDLYLIHCPFFSRESHGISHAEAWAAVEQVRELGLARAIGVSNFQVAHLEGLLATATVKPAVNQIEFHPYLQQPQLVEWCRRHSILIEAYAPLVALSQKLDGALTPVVEEVAGRLGRTPGQVLLRWALQKGAVVLTTSGKPERQAEQLAVGEFQLGLEDMARIDDAGRQKHYRKFWVSQLGASA